MWYNTWNRQVCARYVVTTPGTDRCVSGMWQQHLEQTGVCQVCGNNTWNRQVCVRYVVTTPGTDRCVSDFRSSPVAADPTPTTGEGCRSQPRTSSRGAAMFMLPLHKNSYTEHVQTAHSVSPPSVAGHNQLESGSPHVDSCSVTWPGSFVSRRSYRRTSARYPARQVSPSFVLPVAARCNMAPTWRPLMMQDFG
ncbi:hypothetical protein Bbelb_097420 [Branchiostoma belcheri]|nr:hypothetical protein Bbelb_097420 [Branchiostoma belcheri]